MVLWGCTELYANVSMLTCWCWADLMFTMLVWHVRRLMGSVVTNQSTKCDHGAQRGTFILPVTRVHICVRQLLRHFSGNLRCEPHGGSIGEDRGSLQSQGFILWAPRTTVRHVRVHLTSNTVVSCLQSTCSFSCTNQTEPNSRNPVLWSSIRALWETTLHL